MARFKIPTKPEYNRPGHYDSDAILLIAGSCRAGGPGGWSVGGWTAEGEARVTHGGSMVKGPHAFVFGLCGVIDTYGGTKGEHDRAREAGTLFELEAGDEIEMEGTVFVLDISKRGYPHLTVKS